MPYQKILDELLRSLPGAKAAVLLDSQGELVIEAGDKDPHHRLVGAYQGITLSQARRISRRYPVGEVASLASRYTLGQIAVRSLKDGYYLILALSHEASLPRSATLLSEAAARVNQAL
jgi:predicted regulator of Ras-like GTPase activity (Roadblock/LC7/MglB family)